MEITEKAILDKTHYGLVIYAYILRSFYPNESVLHLSGKKCAPTRNPFNNGSETLVIENHDWIFYYEDASIPNFKGNPFDFAKLHFKLDGVELLTKINEALHLKIDEKRPFYAPKKDFQSSSKSSVNNVQFSLFKHPITNTLPFTQATLLDIYKLVKSEAYLDVTQNLRAINDKKKAKEYKAFNFDYVTFSGIFRKRNDNDLVKHSGLITIDFDHVAEIETLKSSLLKDEYFETELLFVSPSGDGLKWIIPVDLTQGTHQYLFSAISAYIKQTYNLEVDKSGKDISRACFLPFDSNVYINPKYLKQ